MDALQFSVMICCLIMISMQCCCRYYLHPRQEDWLVLYKRWYCQLTGHDTWQDDREVGHNQSRGRQGVICVAMPTFWAAPCPHHTSHASWRQGRHSCIYFHYHLFWPISSSGAPFLGRATQSHEQDIYQTNPPTVIKNIVLAFIVSTLSTNEQSSQRAVVSGIMVG